MSAKIAAVVTYQNATTDIAIEYDSKNKLPVETVSLDDSTGIIIQVDYNKAATDSVTLAEEILVAVQYNLAFTESVSTSEAFSWTSVQNIAESIGTGDTPGIGQIYPVTPTDGITVSDSLVFFHDGMLNTNMLNTRLISAGSTPESGTDVTVTLN
jgi:hypothetical protein